MNKQILIAGFVTAFIGVFGVQSVLAASMSVSISNFQLDENQLSANFSQDFTLTLSPKPTSDVTTTFSTNGECLVGHNNIGFTTGGTVITKTASLYFGLQTLDDQDYEGQHMCDITFNSISSTDSNYLTSVSKSYSFTVEDNDTDNPPGFNVVNLTSARMQEGSNLIETYEVQILKPATDDIEIIAIADDQCDLLIGEGESQVRAGFHSQTISGGTNGAASFTIIPREDSVFEGIHQCRVQHTSSTDDLEYNGVVVPPYVTSITDNDINPDIPDEREYEGGLIYFKDANYDGIDDEGQPQVQSFLNVTHGARQAVIINTLDGNVSQDCVFDSEVRSTPFDSESQSALIVTSEGGLELSVRCDGPNNYQLVWLLDKYHRDARDWAVYQYDESGNLAKAKTNLIIYNLGDDFTSALVIDVVHAGEIKIVQSESGNKQALSRLDEDPLYAAGVTETGRDYGALAVVAIAVIVVGSLGYRKFFRAYDSRRTIAPDIDRF